MVSSHNPARARPPKKQTDLYIAAAGYAYCRSTICTLLHRDMYIAHGVSIVMSGRVRAGGHHSARIVTSGGARAGCWAGPWMYILLQHDVCIAVSGCVFCCSRICTLPPGYVYRARREGGARAIDHYSASIVMSGGVRTGGHHSASIVPRLSSFGLTHYRPRGLEFP